MYRKPNILTKIKLSRLESAGHLERMSDDRTVTEVFLGDQMEEYKRERLKLL
jgi:hypothetical protein